MSFLGNIGFVAIIDKEKNSVDNIYKRWKQTGFIDGLDMDVAVKVSIAFEITAFMILYELKVSDMRYKMIGETADENPNFDNMIFAIVRRVISGFNKSYEHVTEIINMSRSGFNSELYKSLRIEKEAAIIYFYDTILPASGDEWHMNRENKRYKDFKKNHHQKHLSRGGNRSCEDFVPFDVQAEYCAYLARKIENKLREKYEKIN